VLRLLTERPMHGYELIQEISARSENVWRPSPGSIYPTLQLLADEGLISAGVETGGRKLFSLTETGVAEAAKLTGPAPWEQLAEDAESDDGDLRRTIGGLTAAAMQIAWAADTAQRAEAIKVLDEARRKLYLIMAEAGVPDPESGADAES
jgi:DNA-binding PadR family transcriptional regulator